jgi:Tfp pilus assembly protein PilO
MTAGTAQEPSAKRRTRRLRFDVRRDGARAAIVLALVIAVNVGFWLLLVRPRQARISELEERRKTADVIERQELRTLERLREVKQHVVSAQEGVERFFDEMLSTKAARSVRFQRALNDVGKDFKVVPERVSLGLTQLEQEEIEVLGFSFPLSGGYENLRNFLARLEGLEQFLIVREVALRGAREGGRSLELSVNVETYFNAPDLREQLNQERGWREQQRRRTVSGRGR